jgi:hypothetical protein
MSGRGQLLTSRAQAHCLWSRAMGAACVHRDIAAERASELARRIRGIKEAFCRDGIGDCDIGDAGLDAGRAVRHVDGEHFGMREMPSTIASSIAQEPRRQAVEG